MHISRDLTLLRSSGTPERREGVTCSGVLSTTRPVVWELRLPGRPPLTLHDRHWANGERDVVLDKPAVVPQVSAALSNLYNRLWSGITGSPSRPEKRLMMYPTYVDGQERPRIRKSLTTADLAAHLGPDGLRALAAREGVTVEPAHDRPDTLRVPLDLDDPPPGKPFQHALFFPAADGETPVAAFTCLRVVPVLRHIGWLPSR
ncbi:MULTISPECIES: hypothetical protein [Streptomyces]|uniref:Uncharacterized protein n=1 Tax=Streptomyces sudanensis TaxID=436397 RepID=A0ABY4T8W5_9ACTN|nr:MULTISPECIES: hypothetical protein [Streptomyces]URN14831.1 hypothetical protein MW084_01610 [Streptomyces sudanensis]